MSRLRVRYSPPPPPPTDQLQFVGAPGGYPPSTTFKTLTLPGVPRVGSLVLIPTVSFLNDPPTADPQVVDFSTNGNGGTFRRRSLLPYSQGYASGDSSLAIFSHVVASNGVTPYQIIYTVPPASGNLYMAWGALQIDAYPAGGEDGFDDECHLGDPNADPGGAYTTFGPIAPGTLTPSTVKTLALMVGANRGHEDTIHVVLPGAPWTTGLNEDHNSDPSISIHVIWQLTTLLAAIAPEAELVNAITGLPPQGTTGVRSAMALFKLQ